MYNTLNSNNTHPYSFITNAVSTVLNNSTAPPTTHHIDMYANLPAARSATMLEPQSPHLRPAMLLSRWQREAAAEDADPTEIPIYCDRFRMPNEKNNTFFSPLDPLSTTNTYPKDADCTHVLEGEFSSFHYSIYFKYVNRREIEFSLCASSGLQ